MIAVGFLVKYDNKLSIFSPSVNLLFFINL